MIYPLVPFSIVLSDPWPIQGHGVTIDALDVLSAQLTRNLFAIAKVTFEEAEVVSLDGRRRGRGR